MPHGTAIVLVLLAGLLTLGRGTAQAAPVEQAGRLPAHAYLPGAHELPPGLIESGNSYQEFPYGSFASRTFSIPPLHTMTFLVFVHDSAAGARDWMVNVTALGQQKGMYCVTGAGTSGAEEEYVCSSQAGLSAGLMWVVRVGNRSAAVLTAGPATTQTAQLSQAAARVQVAKLLSPG